MIYVKVWFQYTNVFIMVKRKNMYSAAVIVLKQTEQNLFVFISINRDF